MPTDDEAEEFERGEGAGFQAERQGKNMGDGASSDDRPQPSKYNGFWEKFNRETAKRAAERKQD